MNINQIREDVKKDPRQNEYPSNHYMNWPWGTVTFRLTRWIFTLVLTAIMMSVVTVLISNPFYIGLLTGLSLWRFYDLGEPFTLFLYWKANNR